ncbi:MAG TPA: hypothetical protein VF618_24225 [Thermoanaerobaculia bacterium]
MTLLCIQTEIRSMRAELASCDLSSHEAAYFRNALGSMERDASELFAAATSRGGH